MSPVIPAQFAVIGDPISHSLSPDLQNAAFRAEHIPADYTAVRVLRDDLPDFLEDARKHLAGFNITVPHKNAVIPFLDSVSERALLCGSVNTVKVSDGRLEGDTTDGFGFEQAVMDAFQLKLRNLDLCFIGCGGVVPALACRAASAGARSVRILNRTIEKAQRLAELLRSIRSDLVCECAEPADTDSVRRFLAQSALAAQCTSLGLRNDDPAPVDPALLPDGIALYETIYKPTALLCAAQARGLRTANGLSMLLHQGAASFTIWTGRAAPLEAMRLALEDAFRRRSEAGR